MYEFVENSIVRYGSTYQYSGIRRKNNPAFEKFRSTHTSLTRKSRHSKLLKAAVVFKIHHS